MTELLISWPGGSLESALRLAAIVLISYALVLWLAAVVWVYRDVRNRTADQASQLVAVLLVAVFNVPGLIVYLVIRPQTTLADAYERSLETEAILHELQLQATSCQGCRRPIDDDFNICPYCRVTLREPCRNCSRLVRTSWTACPYCTTERQAATRQPMMPPPQAGRSLQPPPRRASARRGPTGPAPAGQAQASIGNNGGDTMPRRPVSAPQQVDS
jgi:RNA polymerase subunit RPABC4/transcription elongation factor Spt4